MRIKDRILVKIYDPFVFGRKVPKEAKSVLEAKYGDLIDIVTDTLPRSYNYGSHTAVIRCAIWFGKEKPLEFCQKLSNYNFEGEDDPCRLLWQYLEKRTRTNANATDIYKKTLFACKAFCENRTIKKLKNIERDLFEWTGDFLPFGKLQTLKQVIEKNNLENTIIKTLNNLNKCSCGKEPNIKMANGELFCIECYKRKEQNEHFNLGKA